MQKKIIIIIIVFFIVMSTLAYWIFSESNNQITENNIRTEADFTTEKFILKEIWEAKKIKGSSVISSYIFLKPAHESFTLRLPWQGMAITQQEFLEDVQEGDSITVKVLKQQLAEAKKDGIAKSVTRFIMGDEREVTIYDLYKNNVVVFKRDITGWDEAKVTIFKRLTDHPTILLIPFFIIIAVVAKIKKIKESKAKKNVLSA